MDDDMIFREMYMDEQYREAICEAESNAMLGEGFDITTAIEDEGNCRYQKINCKDCKMGKFIFENNLKYREGELCKHEIVFLLAKVVKTFAELFKLEMLELGKDKDKKYYRAICIAEEMWEWLADNPECDKDDFPNFEKYGINKMACHCSLCNYKRVTDSICEACILDEICGNYPVLYLCGNSLERQEFALAVWRKCLDERLRIMEWHI